MYKNEKISATYGKKNSLWNVYNKVVLTIVGIWGDTSGFGTTTAKIYTENINGQLYCDVLETYLKRSMAKVPKRTKMIY